MIKNGPNNDNAKSFIDYLLKVNTIENLIESGWCQVSLRDIQSKNSIDIQNLKLIDVSYEEIYKVFPISSSNMTELFIR
jgi:ABC-type Fe3+ transport system substrate-binding protein